MRITYQEIMECGAWDKFCRLHGVSEWAINEGGGHCEEELSIDQAFHLGIVKQDCWRQKPFEDVYVEEEK